MDVYGCVDVWEQPEVFDQRKERWRWKDSLSSKQEVAVKLSRKGRDTSWRRYEGSSNSRLSSHMDVLLLLHVHLPFFSFSRYVSQRCPHTAVREQTRSSSPWPPSLRTRRWEFSAHRVTWTPLRSRPARWRGFTRRTMPASMPSARLSGRSRPNCADTPVPVL